MSRLSEEYLTYINSERWALKSKRCRERAKWRCQKCGCKPPRHLLHAHHKTYKRFMREWQRDLIALCACPEHRCHQKAHGRR